MKLIDKDALVAEIDKRLHQLTDAAFDSMIGRNLIEIRDFLNTLEVKDLQEEPVSKLIDFEKELYKAFGQVKDFTLGMRIAKRFYDMGRKHQEPVGEELEEAAMSYGKSIVQHACDELRKEYGGEYTPGEDNVLLVAKYFKAGAKWQKQQDQSTIELAEDHAMFAGMEKMKEEMMKDAEDLVVGIDANGLACVNVDGVLPDDTVRVLVIKED